MRFRSRSPAPGALSAEVFAIPLDGSAHLVYAPLRRAAFIGNVGVIEALAQLERGPAEAVTNGPLLDLLRDLEIVDGGPGIPPRESYRGLPEPAAVTLFLTTACNLRCAYCYASAGNAPPRYMTLATARRAIDFVAENASRRKLPCLEVGYHGGGEPTVNWPVLTGSHDYAARQAADHRLELRTSMATNGVLDERQIDWVVSHLGGVSVSCDGLPEVHDALRRIAPGGASSARVFHTMRRFDEAKFPYGIRLTVVAGHVARLADSVEFLFYEFRPRGILIEPVYRLGRGAAAESAESEAFLDAYRAASERARTRDGHVQFSGARAGVLTSHFCGVSRDNFCVSADGDVTACFEAFDERVPWARPFFYAKPAEDGAGYRFDAAALARLRSLSVWNRPHCADCFAKWSCAGDCYCKWLAGSGGGEFRGSARCRVIRELTKDQILEKISAAGGIVWHEPGPACSTKVALC